LLQAREQSDAIISDLTVSVWIGSNTTTNERARSGKDREIPRSAHWTYFTGGESKSRVAGCYSAACALVQFL
jgi:hypothetical protein